MTAAAGSADVVHSHTWYANLAGHLASLLYGVPHLVTVHSLEPLRPWKAEQLGGGYALSSWCERVAVEAAAAVVAVSAGMRDDVLAAYPAVSPDRVRVIRNGIDTAEYAPDPATDVLDAYGVDRDRPSVIFVGRITRQKGVPVLLRAMAALDPAVQLVLCAGQPDTPELAAEVEGLVADLRGARSGVIWIPEMLPRREVIQLLSHATVFACPSLYEPLGRPPTGVMPAIARWPRARAEEVRHGPSGLQACLLLSAGAAARARWARAALARPRADEAHITHREGFMRITDQRPGGSKCPGRTTVRPCKTGRSSQRSSQETLPDSLLPMTTMRPGCTRT